MAKMIAFSKPGAQRTTHIFDGQRIIPIPIERDTDKFMVEFSSVERQGKLYYLTLADEEAHELCIALMRDGFHMKPDKGT